MTNKLNNLVSRYIDLQEQIEKNQVELENLKAQIITSAKNQKLKKIKIKNCELRLITISETRFPQQNEPGRQQLEKLVKEFKELDKVMVFDIIKLGNAYDEGKLSPQLMKALHPFAKRVKTTKLRLIKLTS